MLITMGSLAIYTASGELPEARLNEEEVKALGQATVNVARHYPPKVSAKQQDLLALMFCCGQIGMAHFAAYQTRLREERAAKARDVSNG